VNIRDKPAAPETIARAREAIKAAEAKAPSRPIARAFDPSEPIPPYSERPDEIRARFRIA